jgi:hypothetical protein
MRANLKWRADWEAEHGRKLTGRKPVAPDPDGLAKAIINTTDPDSRPICRTGRLTVQGYNAQAVATVDQIIVAADVTQQGVDATQLEPMIAQAGETLASAGIGGELKTVLADGGYWNGPHMKVLGEAGIQVIVPTRSGARTKARKLAPKQGRTPNGLTGS